MQPQLPPPLTPDMVRRKRVIVEILGLEKTGKTHFALTAPDPIFYADLNNRAEGTIDKFVNTKRIHRYAVDMRDLQKTAEDMNGLLSFLRAIPDGNYDIRTVIIDSWDEFRMAEVVRQYGRPSMKPQWYTAVNRTCREIIETFKSSNINLILITQVKKEMQGAGEEAFWTGRYERKGLYDTGALVNVVLQTDFSSENHEFAVRVEQCGYDQLLAGTTFSGPLCNFGVVMANIVPNTTPADWT